MERQENTPSFVDVDGIRTAYHEAGSGRPLLLIHGGDYRTFAHSCDWSLNMETLSKEFRVIAIDKLGQGFTDNPKQESDYTMQAVCDHIESFINVLGLDDLAVVGHSRGGLPSARLAIKYPERVTALVVVDSNTLAAKSAIVPANFYPTAFAGMPDRPDAEHAAKELIMNSFATDHITDSFVEARRSAGLLEKSLTARRIMASGKFKEQFLPDADRLRDDTLNQIAAGDLRTNTLIAWGREDPSAPLQIGIDLYETVASGGSERAEFHVFNRSGHYPYRERAEAFNETLAAFLNSQPKH